LLAAASESPHHPGRILVKSGNRLSFVKISDIDWVEAQGDYVCLHSRQRKHLIREKISAIAQQLPSSSFARIHRSTIINLDRVKEMQPLFYGEYTVILEDGTRLTMSRSFREKVFQGLCAAS
jgi:two-component system LytT family response regulator